MVAYPDTSREDEPLASVRFELFADDRMDGNGCRLVPLAGDRVPLEVDVDPLIDGRIADVQGDLKPATVMHHLVAIRHFHHLADLVSPTDHPKVRETLAGFTRKHAAEPHRAEPLFRRRV
jgi:hypothetical protein